MKKAASSFLTVAVVLWVLPLGAFIKPSQEKTACDGKRAFHMCTMGMSQPEKTSPSTGPSFQNASGVEKTQRSTSGAGGGNEFLTALSGQADPMPRERSSQASSPFSKQSILSSLDPVPKA